MTRESQFNNLLTDWLEDQPDRAPSRLLEIVLTDLQSAPQSARWKHVLRRSFMLNSNGARYLAVGAFGVLVLVIAFNLVNILGLSFHAQLMVKGAIIID